MTRASTLNTKMTTYFLNFFEGATKKRRRGRGGSGGGGWLGGNKER